MSSAASGLQRLLFQVAEHSRQLASSERPGTVHQVKGDKCRVVIGKMKNGEPMLSPWLHTGNHRGGDRERRVFKEGQNVMLSAPMGDIRQAQVHAYAESNKFQAPDHAPKDGGAFHDYQLGDFRIRYSEKGVSLWLQPPAGGGGQQQQQQGAGAQDEQWQSRQPQSPDGKSFIKMKKDGAISAVIDKKFRFMVDKKGVKMKAGNDFAAVTADGKLLISKPWEEGEDPIPDDDETDVK